jgi:hypothetical protein
MQLRLAIAAVDPSHVTDNAKINNAENRDLRIRHSLENLPNRVLEIPYRVGIARTLPRTAAAYVR